MRSIPPSAPKPHPLGHVIERRELTVFFGNRLATPEAITNAFPEYAFAYLNQTHSDVVVLASPSSLPSDSPPEADAHISRSKRLALCIKTADCLPVMIHDPTSGLIAAIHAGWRGIENEIILKTCARLTAEGATLNEARAWIGPHIGAESFVVDKDVADRLAARFEAVRSHATTAQVKLEEPNPLKARIDLWAIASAQLASKGIAHDAIVSIKTDTVTSIDHASFRRDRDSAGRQVSFIALK